MKSIPAFIAAFLITALIGAAMLAIGANALFNPNTVALADSPADSQTTAGSQDAAQTDAAQAQIQQLQDLVNQYQQRDQQYQERLNQAAQQLNQDNAEIQTFQEILIELQRRGVIQVRNDGTILIPSRAFGERDDGHNGAVELED